MHGRTTTHRPSASFAEAANQAAELLITRLVPAVSDEDIAAVQHAIELAQQSPPRDAPAFVARINRVLFAHDLRLTGVDGLVGKLYCRNLPGGGHSIKMVGQNGLKGGFRKTPISVVRSRLGLTDAPAATRGTPLTGSSASPPADRSPS